MKHLFTIFGMLSIPFQIMATSIQTQIVIQAPKEKVWQVLMDFEKYPDWNPFILSITGEAKTGCKIAVKFEEMTFKPKVKIVEENSTFEWLGHLLIPGIFDGRHRFELIDNGDGTTTFKQSENFKGILVLLIKKKLVRDFQPKFEAMNEALKKRVEQ